MKKREVTEAMVERGRQGAKDYQRPHTCEYTDDFIRAILDAAINPPQEPEVVVTREQVRAGFKAYADSKFRH